MAIGQSMTPMIHILWLYHCSIIRLCFGRRLYHYIHSSFVSVDLSHGRDMKGIQGDKAARCMETYGCETAERPYHNPVATVLENRAREEKQLGVEEAAAKHNAAVLTKEDATVHDNAGKLAELAKRKFDLAEEHKAQLDKLQSEFAEAKKRKGPETVAQPVGRAEEPGQEEALGSSDKNDKPERPVPPPVETSSTANHPKPAPPKNTTTHILKTNHPKPPPPAPPPPPPPHVPRVVGPPAHVHVPRVVQPPPAHPVAPMVIPTRQRLSARPATVDASYQQRKHEFQLEVTSKAFRDAVVEWYRNGCPPNHEAFGMRLLRMRQAYEESARWVCAQRQQAVNDDELDAAMKVHQVKEQSKAYQQALDEGLIA